MKKIFAIVVLLISMFVNCRAQDTVQYGDPYYLFNERIFFQNRTSSFVPWSFMCCWNGNFNDSDFVFRYHTGEELVVYGVAVTADTHDLSIDKHKFELNLAQMRND